jgi:hypothetical protein
VHVFNTTAITFAYECHKQVLVELDDLVGSVPGAATYIGGPHLLWRNLIL